MYPLRKPRQRGIIVEPQGAAYRAIIGTLKPNGTLSNIEYTLRADTRIAAKQAAERYDADPVEYVSHGSQSRRIYQKPEFQRGE